MSKSLFLHTTKISAAKVKKIESAGFVCVQVESFDEIKIVSDKGLSQPERILLNAAMEALHDKTNTNAECMRNDFNARVKRAVWDMVEK